MEEALKDVEMVAKVVEVTDEDASFWTAPAKRSDDGALARAEALDISNRLARCESGVASDLPPQSKTPPTLRSSDWAAGGSVPEQETR